MFLWVRQSRGPRRPGAYASESPVRHPPTAPGTVSCLLMLEGLGRKGRGHVDTPVPGPSNHPQGNEVGTMQIRKRSKSLNNTMNHSDIKCLSVRASLISLTPYLTLLALASQADWQVKLLVIT